MAKKGKVTAAYMRELKLTLLILSARSAASHRNHGQKVPVAVHFAPPTLGHGNAFVEPPLFGSGWLGGHFLCESL